LAKGRLLGVQFDTLFTDGLYGEVGRTAIDAAAELRRILSEAGCTFFRESPTNQQFVILENSQMEALAERVRFSFWERVDDTHTAIRFVTSWSTTAEDLAFLETALAATL
jgi:threonine aldolase